MNLGQFDKKFLKSIENEVADDQENTNTVDEKGRLAINSLPIVSSADNLCKQFGLRSGPT